MSTEEPIKEEPKKGKLTKVEITEEPIVIEENVS